MLSIRSCRITTLRNSRLGYLSCAVAMLVELAKVMSKHDGEVCTHLGSDKGLRGGERFEVFAARREGEGG